MNSVELFGLASLQLVHNQQPRFLTISSSDMAISAGPIICYEWFLASVYREIPYMDPYT